MIKEAVLGPLNGLFVGLVAGGGMYVYAKMQQGSQDEHAFFLAVTVFIAGVIIDESRVRIAWLCFFLA